ncbi:MAG: helix-turn-helix domain-containing protein [Pyrinomonadaceae bacterium]
MSVWAKKWAYEQRVGNAGAKAVLVALAEFADETGYCFPSQRTLETMTEIKQRTIRDHLTYLEENKFIQRDHRRGHHGTFTSDGYIIQAPEGALKPNEHQRRNPPAAKSADGEKLHHQRRNPPAAKSATYPSVESDEPSEEPSVIDIKERAREVFDDYCETIKRVSPTPKRLDRIKVRLLEGRTFEHLHSVWLGALRDPWPERKLHNDITHLLETPERIERMIELSTIELSTAGNNGNGKHQRNSESANGSKTKPSIADSAREHAEYFGLGSPPGAAGEDSVR